MLEARHDESTATAITTSRHSPLLPILLALSVIALALLAACASKPPAIRARTDIVARVDTVTITAQQHEAEVARFLERSPGTPNPKRLESLRSDILETMILRILLQNECLKRNVTATRDDLALAADIAFRFESSPAGEVNPTPLLLNLLGQIPRPSARDIARFYQRHRKRFAVPETVRARHIFIRSSQKDNDKILKLKKVRAEMLRITLQQGKAFDILAKKYSDCESRSQGGDLGAFHRQASLPRELVDAAFSQQVNAIGPVVRSSIGWHIVQVLARNKPTVVPLEKASGSIAVHLMTLSTHKSLLALIERLRSKASVNRR